jgi:hypothetical protein
MLVIKVPRRQARKASRAEVAPYKAISSGSAADRQGVSVLFGLVPGVKSGRGKGLSTPRSSWSGGTRHVKAEEWLAVVGEGKADSAFDASLAGSFVEALVAALVGSDLELRA